MRIPTCILLILLGCGLALAQDGDEYITVRDTLTWFDLTREEIANPYNPTAWKFFGGPWATKPAVYFKPSSSKYHGKFQIIAVYGFFNSPEARPWISKECNVFLCEGSSSTGPKERDEIGDPVTISPDPARGLTVADFSDQIIILEEGSSFFVVLDVNTTDGSPWVLLEYTDYEGRKIKGSGYCWAYIFATPGWARLNTTLWFTKDRLGDYALYVVIDYIEVPHTVGAEATSWQKVKAE